MRSRNALRAGFGMLALVALAMTFGCGSRVIDLREPPDPDPVPQPSSPSAALLRLQWAWNHRDPAPLQDLFTADYVFRIASADTMQPVPAPLFRESELEFSNRLFVSGSSTRPPATTVTLEYAIGTGPASATRVVAQVWREEIAPMVHVGVRVPNGDYRVISQGRFELVRGDLARIPQVLIDQGYRSDSTRWWIERWDDEAPAGLRLPPGSFTLYSLKALYLDLPPP